MIRTNRRALGALAAATIGLCLTHNSFGQERITAATFGGAWGDAIKDCILDPFTKSTGIAVIPDPGVNLVTLSKLKQQKTAPVIDVAWIGGGVSELADGEGLLAPIDPQKVRNVANMQSAGVYKNAAGNIFALSAGFYSFGLVYNTKEIKTPPTSWKELWNKDYADRVIIPGPGNGNALPFFVFISKMFGGSIADPSPGVKQLKQLKVASYYDSSGAANNSFATGEAIIGAHDGGAAWAMVDQGLPVAFVVPKEGVPSTDIRVHLVKNTPRKAAAEKLIDFSVGVPAATCMTNRLYLGSATKGVVPNEKAKQRLPWGPNGTFTDLRLNDWNGINANRARLTEILTREVKQH